MSEPYFEIELRARLASFELDYRLATDERFVGIFGPSGAGKTTVIECLAGWRAAGGGRIRVGDRVLFDRAAGVDVPPVDRAVGYVPQDVLLFPHWNVLRNVTAGVRRTRPDHRELLERVLHFLELEPLVDRSVNKLSGGEKRRVALARALYSEPDFLLLDEPLSSLDVPLRRRIIGDLLRVRDEFRVPMILISHDRTEVEVLCHHAQHLVDGRVQSEGHPSVVAVTDELGDRPEFENVLRGRVTGVDGDTATVELADGVSVVGPRAGLDTGQTVVLGLRADAVLLALEEPRAISARNVVAGAVESVSRTGVRVSLGAADDGPRLTVHVTAAALAELGLRPGMRVYAVTKTHSLAVLAGVDG
jgi:molybdate transport system ATP-binding protein